MADLDASPTVEFHRSPRRARVAMGVTATATVALLAAYATVFDEPWWHVLLRYGFLGVGLGVVQHWQSRRQPRLPLRLTDEALQVTRPDGSPLSIDWTNVAHARVRGRIETRLVVEPVDPQLTRPPLRPGQLASLARGGPYEMTVPLTWMTPGPDVLRRELARRLPG